MFPKEKEKKEAVLLRKEGYSIRAISEKIGVAKSSVSCWVREVELSSYQKKVLCDNILNNREKFKYENRTNYAIQNRLKFLEKRKEFQAIGRNKAKEKDWLHSAGCMLYWGEGSKEKNNLEISNSDPFLLRFFIRFLTEIYNVDKNKIIIRVYVHLNNGIKLKEIEKYWLRILDLSKSSLRKTVLVKYSRSSKRTKIGKLPYGTCKLAVYSTELVHKVYGAIQEYAKFKRNDWLF